MRALVIGLGALLLSCDGGQRLYNNNDLQLLTAYSAKEMCSCLFVMGQTEDFCVRFTKQAPDVKTYRIDWDHKSIETQAILFWGARAHLRGPRQGCVLE